MPARPHSIGLDPHRRQRTPGSITRTPTNVGRVLVLASWFPSPANPGLGSFVLEQAQALRRYCGLDVRVLAGRPRRIRTIRPWRAWRELRAIARAQRTLEWHVQDGVPVIDVPYPMATLLPLLTAAAAYARAMTVAADEVRSEFDFALIHAHTAYLDGTAALALRARHRVPCVLTEHTGPFDDLMRRPWTRWAIRRALLGADRTLAVSEALAGDIRRWLPRSLHARIGVLRNGVDPDRFVAPARWTPDPACPRLVALGVMRPIKDPELLLSAFAELRRSCPGASLQIAGEGELGQTVRARCTALGLQDAVRFRGTLDRDATAALLRDECDLLVVSSRAETFGLAAIEALACGKPVVSTRCGGPEEIVNDPALGRLVPVGDAPALAAALREVCSSLPKFDAGAIRRSAMHRFGIGGVVHDLHAIYSELLANHAGST